MGRTQCLVAVGIPAGEVAEFLSAIGHLESASGTGEHVREGGLCFRPADLREDVDQPNPQRRRRLEIQRYIHHARAPIIDVPGHVLLGA